MAFDDALQPNHNPTNFDIDYRAFVQSAPASTVSTDNREPERRSNFNDLYSADYIGLLSNYAFKRFYDSQEDVVDKQALMSLRRSWYDIQKEKYGKSGRYREEAERSINALGGSSTAEKPGLWAALKRMFTGTSFDSRVATRFFQELQSGFNERSLETYNDLIQKAVGAYGHLNPQNGDITPLVTGKQDSDTQFAWAAILYHYTDDGKSTKPNTYSQYQRNLLAAAQYYIDQGGFNGQFTNARSSWHGYEGVTLEELGVSPESLGKMANSYNRYIMELYTALANELHNGGMRLPNNGQGVTASTLREMVSKVSTYNVRSANNSSRLSPDSQAAVKKYLDEWMTYKQAVERIERFASGLRGLPWAEFTVAYCGGRDKTGTDEYWPWWEPNQTLTKQRYFEALDMLEAWDAQNEYYQAQKDAGNITARRPDPSDMDPENRLEFDGSANPAANGPVAGPNRAPSLPSHEASESDWIGR